MLIPRYSIRTIFWIMAGLAVVFLLVGMGIRGHLWAGAIAVGIGNLVMVALSHAALFWLCWVFAGRKPQRKSLEYSMLGNDPQFNSTWSSPSPYPLPLGERRRGEDLFEPSRTPSGQDPPAPVPPKSSADSTERPAGGNEP